MRDTERETGTERKRENVKIITENINNHMLLDKNYFCKE